MLKKRILFLLFCSFFVVATGCQKQGKPESILEETTEVAEQSQKDESEIVVHVCGAVKNPGVYHISRGSRVYEAIERAGGLKKDADASGINQAELLEDESQIYIPTKTEQEKAQAAEGGKVNLNTATKDELMTLSGVGESKADSIISYREDKGKFKKIEEIMEISGIKEGLFQKIKDDITV